MKMLLPFSIQKKNHHLLLIVAALALTTLAGPIPQPQSNDNDDDDDSSGYGDSSADDGSGSTGSEGPDSGWSLSTGAAVAIGVVVGVVVIGAIVMTTLFYLSKKRQWRLRERARGSMRRVGSGIHKAIMTPRTPMQMTFSPSMKTKKSRGMTSLGSGSGGSSGGSSGGGGGERELKPQRFTQSKAKAQARIPDSSPQRQESRGRTDQPKTLTKSSHKHSHSHSHSHSLTGLGVGAAAGAGAGAGDHHQSYYTASSTGPASSSLDQARRQSHSRTRSIGQGLSIDTSLAVPAIGTQAGRTELDKNDKNDNNSRRKKGPPQALNTTAVERVQSESKFEMDSPKTPFLSRFVFGRR